MYKLLLGKLEKRVNDIKVKLYMWMRIKERVLVMTSMGCTKMEKLAKVMGQIKMKNVANAMRWRLHGVCPMPLLGCLV